MLHPPAPPSHFGGRRDSGNSTISSFYSGTRSDAASRRGSAASQMSSTAGATQPTRSALNASPFVDPISPGSSRRSSFETQQPLLPSNQIPLSMSQHFERLQRRRDAISGPWNFPSLNTSNTSSVSTLVNHGGSNNMVVANQSVGLMNDFSAECEPGNFGGRVQASQEGRRGSDSSTNRPSYLAQHPIPRTQSSGVNRSGSGVGGSQSQNLDGMEDLLIPDDMVKYLSQGSHLQQNNAPPPQFPTNNVQRPTTCPLQNAQQTIRIPPPPPYNQAVHNGSKCYPNSPHSQHNQLYGPERKIPGTGNCYAPNSSPSLPQSVPYSPHPAGNINSPSPQIAYNHPGLMAGHPPPPGGHDHQCMSPPGGPPLPTGNWSRRGQSNMSSMTPSPSLSNHSLSSQYSSHHGNGSYYAQSNGTPYYYQQQQSPGMVSATHSQQFQQAQAPYGNEYNHFNQSTNPNPGPHPQNCVQYHGQCPNHIHHQGYPPPQNPNYCHPPHPQSTAEYPRPPCNYGGHPSPRPPPPPFQGQRQGQGQESRRNWEEYRGASTPTGIPNGNGWTQTPPAYSQVSNTSYQSSLLNPQERRGGEGQVQCRNVTSQSQKASPLIQQGRGGANQNEGNEVPRGMRPDTYQRTLKYLQDCEAQQLKVARSQKDADGNPLSPDSTTTVSDGESPKKRQEVTKAGQGPGGPPAQHAQYYYPIQPHPHPQPQHTQHQHHQSPYERN